MMKLLFLLTAAMAASFDAVVVEAKESYNLRQHQSHRLLKKDKVQHVVEIQTNQTNSTEDEGGGEIDWNAFAESISNAAQTSAPPTTAEPTTASPTKTPTPEPSKGPTPSPTPVPTQTPTLQATSGETPTTKPTEFNFSFSSGESVMTMVTLPLFRIEFVATTNYNRRLRQDELLTGDAENTFIDVISSQILSNLQVNQARQLISVELNVEDKRENHFPQMIMFSYDIGGYAIFAGDEDSLPPLPSSKKLLADVLEILNTESFEGALKSFDHSGLLSIDDVVVSALSPAAASIQVADSTGVISDSIEEGSTITATPTVIALVTAFALAMSLIGFITARKLREPNDDDSFGPVKKTYQNIRKKFHYVTPMGNNRQYDQFESPQGSVDSVFGAMQDSDSEYPSVTNVDLRQSHAQQSSGDRNSFLPSHLMDKAFVYESETGSERCQQSLDLLYSDSDSYFGSSVATSIISSGIRPRMSSKDFVYSDTDSSLRSGSELEYKEMARKHTLSTSTHGIANVDHLLLYTDQPSDSEITDGESASQEVVADESNNGQPYESELLLTEDLFARLDELENKLADTECQFANENNITTKEEEEDGSAMQIRDSSDAGVLAGEKLGIIPRDRLRGTPPPSEDELDGDAIDSSKESSLLGNLSFESDTYADDELLFHGSFSTIGSDFDSRL